jgi:hypothetical protein
VNKDRELCLAGDTGIILRASHSNPEDIRLVGPDDHPYTPATLLSEPNCPSHVARESLPAQQVNATPSDKWNVARSPFETGLMVAAQASSSSKILLSGASDYV